MCGRFTLVPGGAQAVPEHFDVRGPAPEARWNVAPTQDVPVIRARMKGRDAGSVADSDARELVRLRWGLIPGWSKSSSSGRAPINARSETVAEKPSFRAAFARRRCLVPASGWYEWEKPPTDPDRPKGVKAPPKQPWLLWAEDSGDPDGQALFAMAGIWERWSPGEAEEDASLETFAILTAPAREEVMAIHPRMPVVLRPDEYDSWLDFSTDLAALAQRFSPSGRPALCARPVSTAVNNARHDAPDCIRPGAGLF